ncbi:MAG: 2-(1,2-epoxy-1,2-dihydrophenyl)acetyl-CoA isomerase [Deltaproteobacteria bacterium]|nr:2-(1,2-epoxy-1,2-dihydrophenyl)acetyl-CoA isomerase [Deltaproteobacteria bacterium]
MNFQFISHEIKNSVAVITLNRPDVLNSFHREMAKELHSAIKECAVEAMVRAVLLTGAGRAFCAGQDLAAVLPKEGDPPPRLGEIVKDCYNPIILALRRLEKPVVCAVNGVAAGAGANLALACDLVFASQSASFVQSFSKIGLIPDSGGTFFLPRLIGLPRATALMMLGEKVSAEEAHKIGMIYKVCAPESLLEESFSTAAFLATQPTMGLGLIKRALNASLHQDLETQLRTEAQLQDDAGRTNDYNEGVQAFIEKRKPIFRGA